MKNKLTFVMALIALTLIIVSLVNLASADDIYVQNFSYSNSVISQKANFAVQVLKYEPYPVSPGESFDLWIKVQNMGQNDAQNAKFVLQLDYPFSSSDNLEQDYGIVFGTVSANMNKKAGEVDIQENQIILKYRVTVDSNANSGLNYIKLYAYSNTNDSGQVFELPITVDKTKTDFEISLQRISADGYSFLVSNVGQNNANSLSISLVPQDGISFNGDRIFVIGNLNTGDFTKFTAPITVSNNAKNVQFNVEYTDSSGARRSVIKTVDLQNASNGNNQNLTQNNNYNMWIYILIAFILGVLIMYFVKIKR